MKKVLIITYYWPPSGGGGVQRWLKFSKYLPENGWQPVIFTPESPEFSVHDTSLEKEVNPQTEIIKCPIWEPYNLFKFLMGKKKEEKVNTGLLFDDSRLGFRTRVSLWIRGNLLIPDPRVFWIRPATRFLSNYLKNNPVDAIVTTGPPHSTHLIGFNIFKEFNISWIADFRDPWSQIDYLDIFRPSWRARAKQKKLEHRVITNASIVLTVSRNWGDKLKRLGAKRVEVITNGYDEDDFKDFKNRPAQDKFRIYHTGIINTFRNPVFIWQGLAELCSENLQFAEDLEISLIGIKDKSVIDSIKQFDNLFEKTSFIHYMPHAILIREYEKASVLLLLLNDTKNVKGHIPGKFFEYLASAKPIICICPKDGDCARILYECHAGITINNNDMKVFKEKVHDYYESFKRKQMHLRNPSVKKYSRKELTKNLVVLLNDL